MDGFNETLTIITALMAIAAVVVSIIALRRTSNDARLDRQQASRDAAFDRELGGPIPHLSLVFEYTGEVRAIRILIQNKGRAAITMSGGGLAFTLADGGHRLVTIGYDEEMRVDPEGSPRGYILTAPVLRNVLSDSDPSSSIRPFVILGTETLYGDQPLPRALIEGLVQEAPPAPDQTYRVIETHGDFLRDRALIPQLDEDGAETGAHNLSDGTYHAMREARLAEEGP